LRVPPSAAILQQDLPSRLQCRLAPAPVSWATAARAKSDDARKIQHEYGNLINSTEWQALKSDLGIGAGHTSPSSLRCRLFDVPMSCSDKWFKAHPTNDLFESRIVAAGRDEKGAHRDLR
jgi:hypothetical protein